MGHGWNGKLEQWTNDCYEYYLRWVFQLSRDINDDEYSSLTWHFFVLCSIWSCFPGAWQGAKEFEFKVWHSNIEKYVYQESPWISKYIDTIINSNPNLQNGFMCAHVRRGNFKKACRLYDEEMQSGYLYYLFLHKNFVWLRYYSFSNFSIAMIRMNNSFTENMGKTIRWTGIGMLC